MLSPNNRWAILERLRDVPPWLAGWVMELVWLVMELEQELEPGPTKWRGVNFYRNRNAIGH